MLAAGLVAAPARAADPNAVWTPQVYSLGEAGDVSLVPVVISTRMDLNDSAEDVVVLGERAAPLSSLGWNEPTPQSVFNVGRDAMMRPVDCTEPYTTVAGQPSSGADLAEHVGVRGCYF
jgi:hypothetical protein